MGRHRTSLHHPLIGSSATFFFFLFQSRVAKFLLDDVLTVGVELTVYGDQNSTEVEPDLDLLSSSGGTSSSGAALANITDDLKLRLESNSLMGAFL